MKKILIILSLIVFSVMSLSAQKPIKWRSSVKMTSQSEGIITIKAIIGDGWHLYGTDLPNGGPKATTFDFSSSEGVVMVGSVTPSSKPKEVHDKVFDLNLNWWENDVIFTQNFKLTGEKNAKIMGRILYMGCNDETCLPPSAQSINIKVPPFK